MKTSSFANRRGSLMAAARTPPLRKRSWPRVFFCLSLMVAVEIALVYLVSWVGPPQRACLISIAVNEYQSRPLSSLVRTTSPAGLLPSTSATRWRNNASFAETVNVGTSRQAILQTLDSLAKRGSQQPVVVYLSALTVQADEGDVYLLPSDATPEDAWTWLRLREVLLKLKACPARQKLLILDSPPPNASARLGSVYHDVAAAIPRELKAVRDADRCVLCSCSAGQVAHTLEEEGQSIFSYYLQQGLAGDADGWEGLLDGHISIKELAAFVTHRVERWAWRNRGERQTPMLFGVATDAPLVACTGHREAAPPAPREYPAWLLEAWKARDAVYQSGQYRLAPRLFQQQQAILRATEQAWRAGLAEAKLQRYWVPECERLQASLQRTVKELVPPGAGQEPISESMKKSFEEAWRNLQQQIAAARPAEVEQIKNRLCNDLRDKFSAEDLDNLVFLHALSDPHLDPGTLRLYDHLLHSTSQQLPRTAATLRLRQLADLAMRVEVFAWPRELIEVLLRCTDRGSRALQKTPNLPCYQRLLEEPTQLQHGAEVRLWARGFASLDEAKKRITTACDQFDRLLKLNDQWQAKNQLLDEALAELPNDIEVLEVMPALRPAWEKAVVSTKALAETLQAPCETEKTNPTWQEQVDRVTALLKTADTHAQPLRHHLQTLRMPFGKEAVARLEKQCQSPHADAVTFKTASALLRTSAPCLRAEDRATVWRAAHHLAQRLHQDTLAIDRQENEAKHPLPIGDIKAAPVEEEHRRAIWRTQMHLTLCDLAGVAEQRLRPARQDLEQCKKEPNQLSGWCDLGATLQRLLNTELPQQYREQTSAPQRERLTWFLSALDRYAGIDDGEPFSVRLRREEINRQKQWQQGHYRYLARDYHGLNLESPGIQAARSFYDQLLKTETGKSEDEPHVRLKVLGPLDVLTQNQPHAHGWLEITRWVPPGKYGPVQLQFYLPEDAWLDVAPQSATVAGLRAARESRTLVNTVPIKVMRKPMAERSGLAPPAGLLVEARFEDRHYHHLVATPITPDTREVQIIVSSDPEGPRTTLSDIRVRPGKARQPHYVYVKNLTNRPNRVHVDIQLGDSVLSMSRQPMLLEPDGIHKVFFAEPAFAKPLDGRGALQIQVLDSARQKVLDARTLQVGILAPHEYVDVAQVSFEPGGMANGKWAAQVSTSRLIAGPAITAELVLPAQRIPGLRGVGGGTLHVELPIQSKTPRLLSAEKIQFANETEQEGPVYLTIDGVPRAFVYRTNFTRTGSPVPPVRDDRAAVRLLAPASIMAGVNFLVDVEVDNAPEGARLEVVLGRIYNDEGFKPELVREFATAKKQRIGLEASKDALNFDASIQDWTATFDTRAIVGTRELRTRLLDATGKELAVASQSVVIDSSAPVARFLPLPPHVKRGSVIQVQADGFDLESGIAEVFFFLGRPSKGEIPPGATKMRGISANLNSTLWVTPLAVPAEHKGPLTISVYVVNRAGMASVDTATMEIMEYKEPVKIKEGQILGRVVEGPRPQPNLVVILSDEKGKEIARTRTLPDGSFGFVKLPPGRYRLLCVKPESQRRASQGVTVDADRASPVELSLAL